MRRTLCVERMRNRLKHETKIELDKFEGYSTKTNTKEKDALVGKDEIDDDCCNESDHESPIEYLAYSGDVVV